MKELEGKRYMFWKNVQEMDSKTGKMKTVKKPVDIQGITTSYKDEKKWLSCTAAASMVNDTRKLAYVLCGSKYVGIDFDISYEDERVQQALTMLDTYWEVSQSGVGAHAFLEVEGVTDAIARKEVDDFAPEPEDGGKKPNFFEYLRGYVTYKGDGKDVPVRKVSAVEFAKITQALLKLCKKAPVVEEPTVTHVTTTPTVVAVTIEQIRLNNHLLDTHKKWAKLSVGDDSDYEGNASNADLAAANILAAECPRAMAEKMFYTFRSRPKVNERPEYVKDIFDKAYEERNPTEKVERCSSRPVLKVTFSNDTVAKAKEIYESGKFFDYCHEVWRKVWFSDTFILDFMLLQAGLTYVENADSGIHIAIQGDPQSGKSGAAKLAIQFIRFDRIMNRTCSPKYLFYEDNLKEKTTALLDDTEMTEEMAQIMRGPLTQWRTGSEHGVVDNMKKRVLSIPKRVSLVITNVDSIAKNQYLAQDDSRYLKLNVRRSKEDKDAVFKLHQQVSPSIAEELDVIQAMWDMMVEKTVKLHTELGREDKEIRDALRRLDMILARALLCGRDTTNDEDIAVIKTLEHYVKFQQSATASPPNDTEIAVLKALKESTNNSGTYIPLSVGELQERTNYSDGAIRYALHGRGGSMSNPNGGLLVNSPHVKVEDVEKSKTAFVVYKN